MKTGTNWQWYYITIVHAAKNYLAQAWSLNILLVLLTSASLAQNSGSLKVQVLDSKSKESIAFANVLVYKDSALKAGVITDLNGEAIIKPLAPDVYNVKVVYLGYQTKQVNKILVMGDKTTYITIHLSNEEGVQLNKVDIVEYKVPLIDPDTRSGSSTDRQHFQNMANKSVGSVVSTSAGVYQNSINIRGSRSTSTHVFIDGERAIGTVNIPQQAVEQVNVTLGGLPAQYGDVSGGVIFGAPARTSTDIFSSFPNSQPTVKYTPPAPTQLNIRDNTEEYGLFIENGFTSVNGAPLSTFAIDVDGASYSNARRYLNEGMLPPKDAVRIEEFVNYFKYNYPKVSGDKPFNIFSEYNECPWNKGHKLLQVALKGKELDNLLTVPNHLVFLIDVSGSMESEDKLPLLKKALALLVKQLRPQDKLSMVVYAGSSGLVLEAVGGSEKVTITEALDRLNAGGSTAGGEGINLAYKIAEKHFIKEGNNRVILATDGDFNVGVSSEKELEDLITEKRGLGIYLSVLGFGEGNIKDSKMEILADKGNGNYYYIDNFSEARKVLVSQFGGTMYAIAKDVKIQVEFNPATVKEYRLIGYDNRLLAAEDFNNDKKDAGELGAGHCVTALYEIIPAGSSESMVKVDELKYKRVCEDDNLSEIATIKFRYKGIKKEDTVSQLIKDVVLDQPGDLAKASVNFKLAAGICEFAMLLKDSDHKGNTTFRQAVTLVSAAKDTDDEGYVAGLIELINTAKELKPDVAVKR